MQKPDGSFGESADSYEDPSLKGTGASTASQTAWGAMGLMAAARRRRPRGRARAIDGWSPIKAPTETGRSTSTPAPGFPKVFYLKYHLYRLYFPLTALSRYRRLSAAAASGAAT